MVWNRFMMVRDAYRAFQRTLTKVQLRGAANELADKHLPSTSQPHNLTDIDTAS